ncbi:hypothetical protein EPUS_03552 [Endocarpon pusillum Z07020]|uniref:Uncharacterized protein n=1 Tax=Endocarpon pusillum (strain Z07020 / HMAS-L-300199) TaxID=1263415 RepID=U1HIG5_ENDPU|nr:uncharacterized protein EPUS_03552 [Endocarpon pusillum Z07020]ERF70000.1 hypothetical protein EPUS_03552 [Endocarpon pusillum Z07020]
MPPKRKGRKFGPKSEAAPHVTNPVVQKTSKRSTKASTRRRSTRAGLRSEASTDYTQPLDNPDSVFRRRRKFQKAQEQEQLPDQPKNQSGDSVGGIVQSVETTLLEVNRRLEYEIAYEHSDEVPSPGQPETDPEQLSYRKWGNLPPFDEEVLAVIEAIIADPGMANTFERTGPQHDKFPEGLEHRNVFLEASTISDPYKEHVHQLESKEFVSETAEERASSEQLWRSDQAKCIDGSNEALFQRTVMMTMIARHRLVHDHDRDTDIRNCLDYSVEESWTCPPMPTRAYRRGMPFLTQPKPDLAWREMPTATRRLACFEKDGMVGRSRVFHFFTIEAKKASTSTGNMVGQLQSLNNASQALHNMFEFFRDAGEYHEKAFFDKVRFFSAVASTEGLIIRIHRATREPSDGSGIGLIMKDRPEYPLRFEYQEFARIQGNEFERITVLELPEKILLRYGADELHPLLKGAAAAIMERLGKHPEELALRDDVGQPHQYKTCYFDGRKSRASMGLPSRPVSEANVSVDMLQNGATTPTQATHSTQGQPLVPAQPSNGTGKRSREVLWVVRLLGALAREYNEVTPADICGTATILHVTNKANRNEYTVRCTRTTVAMQPHSISLQRTRMVIVYNDAGTGSQRQHATFFFFSLLVGWRGPFNTSGNGDEFASSVFSRKDG